MAQRLEASRDLMEQRNQALFLTPGFHARDRLEPTFHSPTLSPPATSCHLCYLVGASQCWCSRSQWQSSAHPSAPPVSSEQKTFSTGNNETSKESTLTMGEKPFLWVSQVVHNIVSDYCLSSASHIVLRPETQTFLLVTPHLKLLVLFLGVCMTHITHQTWHQMLNSSYSGTSG